MRVAQLARAALPLLLVTGERKQPPLLVMEHAAAVEAKDYGRCAEIDKEIAERQRQMETEMGGGLQS
jgi:hypothetical protein